MLMQNFNLFVFLPLWVTFVGIVAIVLLSILLGIYIANVRKRRAKPAEEEGPIGTVVSATLGLLAFILAFTFGLTASRFDTRRQSLLDEVTAIETTALRAELIPEPQRSEVRDIMRKYIELRLDMPQNPLNVRERIRQSEELQRRLWPLAAAMANADLKNPDVVSLFVDSVNEMMNVQTRRVSIANYHIPWLIWLVLFGVTVLSMIEVGYLFGRSGSSNWLFIVALSLAFSGVMILIVDLDRSGTGAVGTIQINQQPMIDLHERLYGTPGK
jgi:hypothetical protein